MCAGPRGQPRLGDRPRVLLLWPGGLFRGGANFGVPQLLLIAGLLQRRADARVDVVDLDMERVWGRIDLQRIAAPGYDVVGLSCYSSYDYLKVTALAAGLRRLLPAATLVVGGYHPSAVPDDFIGEDSPFDYVVVGDGEAPLLGLVQALARSKPPDDPVLGPEPWTDLDELMPYEWSLLERYRPVARRVAAQAEIYLSRGCPFDCAFCMEGAKGETRWRALSPESALAELHRLDDFLDLSRWTLFVTDAIFGAQPSWRRQVLEALADRPLRARKIWLLTRLDGLERTDLELMRRANVAPGFGLESGDPDLLALIHKTGKATEYLERMRQVASWARQLEVPFGANVIVGHPGETERSMQRSAAYLEQLFLGDDRGTTGFLSVDPFRLYPGSRIAAELPRWQRDTGMRAHRYPWWHDGDQDFLAEWVDPSTTLDFRRTLQLRRELFDPIVRQIARRYSYRGPAAEYFQRSVDEQVRLTEPRHDLHTLGLWHLWRGLVPHEGALSPAGPADDDELRELAREARRRTLSQRDWTASTQIIAALERVPRERFVRLEDMGDCASDRALALSDDGRSTLSALHAYAAAFDALELGEGDQLTELGSGNGYGATVASEVVGPQGRVRSFELDSSLAAEAREHMAGYPQAQIVEGDAHQVERWRGASKVYVAFSVSQVPPQWLDALDEPGRMVVPIGAESAQVLTLIEKTADGLRRTALGPVRYVRDRS